MVKALSQDVGDCLSHRDFIHISDRDKGSVSVVREVFPNVNHMHCFKHIVANLSRANDVKGLGPREHNLWRIQGLHTEDEFNQEMTMLHNWNPGAAHYLWSILGGDDCWA